MNKGHRYYGEFRWQLFLGLILLSLSAFFYLIHYFIFHDIHHILIYFIGDIAFVFCEVLLVALVLNRLLVYQERRTVLKKLNMIIGAFFSEVGFPLLKLLAGFDTRIAQVQPKLVISARDTEQDFKNIQKILLSYQPAVEIKKGDLAELKEFLSRRRDSLLNLLRNSNLLEHESFTDTLWAIFHLTEELMFRPQLTGLPGHDYEHLAGDAERAYRLLIVEWLAYMKHLRREYSYLFSLAIRTNPFDRNASVVIND